MLFKKKLKSKAKVDPKDLKVGNVYHFKEFGEEKNGLLIKKWKYGYKFQGRDGFEDSNYNKSRYSDFDDDVDPEIEKEILNRRKEYVSRAEVIQTGNILYGTYNCGAPNVVYYEVIKATKSMVTVREIATTRVFYDKTYNQGQYTAGPTAGKYIGPEIRRKIIFNPETLCPSVKIGDGLRLYLWDGVLKSGDSLD